MPVHNLIPPAAVLGQFPRLPDQPECDPEQMGSYDYGLEKEKRKIPTTQDPWFVGLVILGLLAGSIIGHQLFAAYFTR